MSEKQIRDSDIISFIKHHLDVNDFGYLVVPDDKRLNDEALSNIKAKFKKFIDERYEK